MLRAVATIAEHSVSIVLSPPDEGEEGEETGAEQEEHLEVPENDLNPIAPEVKEMAWGFGAFVVFALLMRFFLYPRLKAGTDSRYAVIRQGHEDAERLTDSARGDVAQYDSQLAAVKAEAQQRIEAARAALEAERSERLADVNARIADKRAVAATEVEAARAAVQADVEAAVGTVAARAGELATGRAPDRGVVAEAVAEVMGAGVGAMIALAALALRLVLRQPPAEEEGEAHFDIDDDGYVTSSHWLWPEQAEIIYGGLASLIVIGLLVWKAGPLIKKALADRTARIQAELDASAKDRADAEAEASRIRQALGDIDAERQRLLAEADAQAEALLTDGHGRLDAELAELEAKAEADIAAAATRSSDELRAEIARLATAAADRVVSRSLDEATQQRLVEDFIQKVGATS